MSYKTPSKAPDTLGRRKNVLYQVSLLQGLTNGDYYGSVTLEELKGHGDTGLGTFHALNGELIMLDGFPSPSHHEICIENHNYR